MKLIKEIQEMTNQTTTKIRDSFIFYRSFYQSIKKLPAKDKAEIFDAICNYALDGQEIEMSIVPEALFTVIKPNLDANRRKWENGCKEKKKDDELEESKPEAKDKQTESKPEGNVNVNKDKEENKDLESESQFQTFWETYKEIHTSKGSKQDANKSFLKALKKSTFEEIMQGLKNYMADCHSKGSYTKQVVVWLNKECWKDEYSSKASEPKSDYAKWKEAHGR